MDRAPATESVITVAVEYDGGEIREFQPTEDSMDFCEPRLEVEVLIHAATEDGLFDETFEGTLKHGRGALGFRGLHGRVR